MSIRKKTMLLFALLAMALLMPACGDEEKSWEGPFTSPAVLTAKSQECLKCHVKKQPAIVMQWQGSVHAEEAVGCYECHKASPSDTDAYEHYDETIATIVSPKDCGECHKKETKQFLASHHSQGGKVLGSLDNYLGEVVEGLGASISGCQQCHGSKVAVLDDGSLRADTYPNFGIGRINPDGTAGACVACHSRHEFSLAQARSPETCSRCHMGPDHPQKEVYEESKHNIAYRSRMDQMNMDSPQWVVGRHYGAAPTCATCHVSATVNQQATHDIGVRMSWNIRAPVSFKTDNSELKRKRMQDVCYACHNPSYVKNHYVQIDAGIELYNEKFARPAGKIMDRLREAGKIDEVPFNEHIEWLYFYLWHHEGRRTRNGIVMMGPDYVQWHGFYEVAERFYIELVPEAEHLMPGVTEDILSKDEHKWFRGELTPEERRQMLEFYRSRYLTRSDEDEPDPELPPQVPTDEAPSEE